MFPISYCCLVNPASGTILYYGFQVYETLEHRLVVAEAAQRLRLPLISKDGEIHEEEIEKWSIMSRSSLDSTSTNVTISSSSNSVNYTNSSANSTVGGTSISSNDGEPSVGGVPNRFLGITPSYLWQAQLQQSPLSMVLLPAVMACNIILLACIVYKWLLLPRI